jgi:hypothetical protein
VHAVALIQDRVESYRTLDDATAQVMERSSESTRTHGEAELLQHGREDSMSQRDVERALGRLLTDEGFQRDFFRDPARACLPVGLQLAPEEVEALLRVPRPALTDLAGRLDDRICRLHVDKSGDNGQ